jgi:hypothetical protein
VVGDKFWSIAGKENNQKVKDLIQSKISNIPRGSTLKKKPQKAPKLEPQKAPKLEPAKEESKSKTEKKKSKEKKSFVRGKIAASPKMLSSTIASFEGSQKRKSFIRPMPKPEVEVETRPASIPSPPPKPLEGKLRTN